MLSNAFKIGQRTILPNTCKDSIKCSEKRNTFIAKKTPYSVSFWDKKSRFFY